MPATNLSAKAEAQQHLDRLIRMYVSANRMTFKELAKRMSISPSTLERRMNDLGGFELSELRVLRYVLGIPKEEMMEAINPKL